MTFLFDPAQIDTFFRAPDFDITFRPAIEQFTQRVFGLPSKQFFPKHSFILQSLRHLLVPGELHVHAENLSERALFILERAFPHEKEVLPFDLRQVLFVRSGPSRFVTSFNKA